MFFFNGRGDSKRLLVASKETNNVLPRSWPRATNAGLVLATPVVGSVAEYQRVILFRGNRRVPQNREDFFVDVPFGVAPREVFRVYVRGREYDVVCPDIGVSGERIVVSYLSPCKT